MKTETYVLIAMAVIIIYFLFTKKEHYDYGLAQKSSRQIEREENALRKALREIYARSALNDFAMKAKLYKK